MSHFKYLVFAQSVRFKPNYTDGITLTPVCVTPAVQWGCKSVPAVPDVVHQRRCFGSLSEAETFALELQSDLDSLNVEGPDFADSDFMSLQATIMLMPRI